MTWTKCSIRKSIPLALMTLSTLAGCQRIAKVSSDPVSQTPIKVDGAMARRTWDQTVVIYPTGASTSYGQGIKRELKSTSPEWTYTLSAPALFVAQSFRIPFGLVFGKAWEQRPYYGAAVPPTNTAMPPLEKNEVVFEKTFESTGNVGPALEP